NHALYFPEKSGIFHVLVIPVVQIIPVLLGTVHDSFVPIRILMIIQSIGTKACAQSAFTINNERIFFAT
ncbi:hypothetical protein ACHAXS_007319, partial [Conticribra weissflogii]